MSSSNLIPDGWDEISLRDILHGIEAGKSFECEQRRAAPDEWGVIKVSAMTWGQFDEDENKAVPASKDIAPQYEIRTGDLLLSRSNTVELVGASVLVNTCRPKLLLSDKSMRLLAYDEINRAWLQRVLSSPDVRAQLSSVATGSSNSMRNVSQDKVLAVRFGLPPKNEQRRIVAKIEELFSDLDAGVAALKRAKANLKRYRAAVLKAAVEGKLTEAWRATHPTNEPASALLARILKERRQKWEAEQLARFTAAGKEPPKNWREKYVEPTPPDTTGLPELPDGWCWASVDQIGDIQLGRQRSPQNRSDVFPTKYIRAANLTESGLDLTDVLDMEFQPKELETYRLHPGDVLLSEASGSPDQVGKPVVWNGEIDDCCFQNTVIRLRPIGIRSEYPLTVFRHYYRSKLFAKVSAGVGINHLSAGKFSALPFPLAPLAEQKLIVAEVEERLSVIGIAERQLENNLARATRLRQSILKQAFEGKLVPQDPKDEPASVLLERLRANRAVHEGNGKATTPSRPRGRRVKSQQLEGRADA